MEMNLLIFAIFMPIISGIICLFIKRLSPWIAVIISVICVLCAGLIFSSGEMAFNPLSLYSYVLSSGLYLAAAVFTMLNMLYSLKFMENKERSGEIYGYNLITLGAVAGVFFANDFLTLLLYWGILGATLYMLIGISGPRSATAAKKTFIIVGGADAFMILGIGIIMLINKSVIIGISPITLSGTLPVIAFLSLCSGALAKAGAMPFHSWITDSADVAPVPVMALLPASLDKLLGIYLLVRICTNIFLVVPNSAISILLLTAGSISIIIAVMAALFQHDIKKLLAFHSISQVGYMVLGIGTAIPIGIAGGIFHMLNNAIYKSCLFYAGGAVEQKTGTTDLDELGGLARTMPLTFISAAIAALSISGIPPMNGFTSKWMIYQGIIELSRTSDLWIIWLVAAMFGSALTLASFFKLIHSVFLGQSSRPEKKFDEVPISMWFPMVFLAALCLLFGIFAFALPLPYFILPSLKTVIFTGSWQPALATVLILVGLLSGLFIYWIGRSKIVIEKPYYIGGEILEERSVKLSGTEIYNTIKDIELIDRIYKVSEAKTFDIYEAGKKITFALNGWLSGLHDGILDTYLSWMFLGAVIILLFMVH